MAEHSRDAEHRDGPLDAMMTVPPLTEWSDESREALRETCSYVISIARVGREIEQPTQTMNSDPYNQRLQHTTDMTAPSILIGAEPLGVGEALKRLEQYASRHPHTLETYDYPGSGSPQAISPKEIARTRKLSSRISAVHGDWFIERARTAPWTPVGGDLRDADPTESGGLYDAMIDLYDHFATAAPDGVKVAKISKVLHLKRPTQFPVLDSRLTRIYAEAAARTSAIYPSRSKSRMYWAAIRSDLIGSAAGFTELRQVIAEHPKARVRELQAVSDLRLHDMISWRPRLIGDAGEFSRTPQAREWP